MKPWNVNEIHPRYSEEPRLKTLARRLRDWLNGFLEEAGNSVADQGRVPSPVARSLRNSSTESARGQNDAGSASGGQAQAGVSPWNALQQPSPPEDWLRRVREGAPQLLRSIEGGRTFSSTPPRPAIENGEPQREATSASASPLHSHEESVPVLEERTIEGTLPSSTTAASRTNSWFQRLHRRLRPTAFTQGEAKIKPQHEEHSVTQARARREPPVVIAAPAWPEPAGEASPQFRRPSQPVAIESEQPAMSKIGGEATPHSRWRERLWQKVQALLPAAATNRSASKAFIGRTNEEAVSPKSGEAPSPGPAAVSTKARVGQFSVEVPPDRSLQCSSGLRPQGRAQDAPGLWPDLPTGASFPASIKHLRNQTQESDKANASQRAGRKDEPSATQPVDRWPLASARWPDPEQVDPWPALPEDPPRATTDWAHFLRNAERLRALDLEQRGGR